MPVLNTTPTIKIAQSISAPYQRAVLTFKRGNNKIIKTNPRNVEGVFYVDFSQDELAYLCVGTASFEIQYFYDNDTKTNIETGGQMPIYAAFSDGKANGTGGIEDETIYTAKVLQETVEVGGGVIVEGTKVTTNGVFQSAWETNTKQDVLSNTQIANIDDVQNKATIEALAAVKQTADSAVQIEVDPTVPAWAKGDTKPQYTSAEVGALPANTPLFDGEYDSLTGSPDLTNDIVDLGYNSVNGVWTFTRRDGTTKLIDQPIEKLLQSGSYNSETKNIELVLVDGSKLLIPAQDMVKEYEADETTLSLNNSVFSLKQTIIDNINSRLTQSVADQRYEQKFEKNDGFNRKFGNSAGTVVEGNRVLTDVPENAVFTDTKYDTQIQEINTKLNNTVPMVVTYDDDTTETFKVVVQA